MKFYCYGHSNIIAGHKSTLEITKDSFLSSAGDCIIGVRAEFSHIPKDINRLVISCGDITDEVKGTYNPSFSSMHDIVLRKSKYKDERTLMINCDKAASDIKRELIENLKKGFKAQVRLCEDK